MNLIAELQAARKRQGLKQQELAEQAGLSRMTVQRIESGAIDPRLSTLAEMARVLGLQLVAVASEQPHPLVAAPGAPIVDEGQA